MKKPVELLALVVAVALAVIGAAAVADDFLDRAPEPEAPFDPSLMDVDPDRG